MAEPIRIKDLPSNPALSANQYMATDLTATEKATIADIVNVGRPFASQAQAEGGVNSTTAMSPLTTKQAIAALGATKEQGQKADQLPNSLSSIKGLTVSPFSSTYALTLPPQVSVDQFKSQSNTYSDALAAAKAYMASLTAPISSGPGMFVVPAGTDLGGAGFDFQDAMFWFMPGHKAGGSIRPRIEHHLKNLPPNFKDHEYNTWGVERYFDGKILDWNGADPTKTNGYNKAGAAISALTIVGRDFAAVGTPFAVKSEMLVYDTLTPDVGRSEMIATPYSYLEAVNGRSQPGTNWWAEDTILISPAAQTGWVGGSRRIHKMWGTHDTSSDSYLGSVPYSAVTRPILEKEATTPYGGSRIGQSNQMLAAMFWGGGWAGQTLAGDPINSGTAVGATAGVDVVFSAGGAKNVYLSPTARSFINYAFAGEDYAKDGLLLYNPHPSFNGANYAAIRVAQDAGRVFLGINGSVGYSDAQLVVGNSANSTATNIRLVGSRHVTSEKTGIDFNGVMAIGTDEDETGAGNMFWYHATSTQFVLRVNTDGTISLPALGTTNPGPGKLYMNSTTRAVTVGS